MVLAEKFEVHDFLNPKLWSSDNKLLNDAKLKLVEIIDQFISTCDIPLHVVDVHLVGSNASYNYTQHSDLDVHVIANFELLNIPLDVAQIIYNAVKAKFNADYNISIRGVDVEMYIEDIRSTTLSNGIYSLYRDEWIKFPKKLTAVPQVDITDEVSHWIDRIQSGLSSGSSQEVEDLIDALYLIRKTSLDTEGEYGKGNQLFKEVRNLGLLDDLKDAYKTYRSKELTLEHLTLNEDSRTSLLAKSKRSDKGFERFKKRVKSRVANTVKQYNSIDMNKLFKDDILTVDVQVRGETDTYSVKISFGGFLEILHDQLRNQEFGLKVITRALISGFNRDDVFIHCSCPDAQYRFSYWQTRNSVNSGDPETRPANITNPNDSLGSACKHVLLVLSNTSWLLKVASTIFNYVNYMEKHYERLYQKVIYPAIYQHEYEEAQLDMFDDDNLDSDSNTIDTSNEYARSKNQFKSGNEYQFKPGPDKDQISFDDLEDSEPSSLEG